MKNIKYILPGLLVAGAFTACNDLDTEPMSSVITEEQRAEVIDGDPAKIEAVSAGVYANYNAQEGTYAEFFDFGLPALFVQYESRTADMVSYQVDLYGWFSSCAEYLDNTSSSTYDIPRWRLPYNVIYTANQVLSSIDPDTDDNTLKFYRAQAYGNRAYAYWLLAQGFQFNYAQGYADAPCVPIITEENQLEVAAEGAPRATVAEVYEQILSDLNTGLELVQGNSAAVRQDKRYVDESVLLALRARTYLCMADYANAAADAQAVIDSGKFTPLSARQAMLPGFNDLSASNWIWGVNMDSEDVMGLYTFAGFMSSWVYGYTSVGMFKLIDNVLYDQIPADDARKLWFISPNGTSNAQYYTEATSSDNYTAEEYLESVDAPIYANTKFAGYGNKLGEGSDEGDVPIIRIEEMYLILAEAQGMGGNVAQGIQTLEDFVNKYRWLNSKTSWSCSASSATAFLDAVWVQRRIELWGEGINYFDILRLGKGVDRQSNGASIWLDHELSGNMEPYAFVIPANSPVLIYQIPRTVIDNNPMLTDADQNPAGQATL